MPPERDWEYWFRAEDAWDPSNAALVSAFVAHGGPAYRPRGPAPGTVYDSATIHAQAAAADAESRKLMAQARGGGFGPAGTTIETNHRSGVPSWAKLVVGGDVPGGDDGGLPVWVQEIREALPPSVLEQMAEGVKVDDTTKVTKALNSLTATEKERLGESVNAIPADIKALLDKTLAPSVHHYTMKKRKKYDENRRLEWVRSTVTQTTTDAAGAIVAVKLFELEGPDADKTVEEISKMVISSFAEGILMLIDPCRLQIEEGYSPVRSPTSGSPSAA